MKTVTLSTYVWTIVAAAVLLLASLQVNGTAQRHLDDQNRTLYSLRTERLIDSLRTEIKELRDENIETLIELENEVNR